MKWREKSLSYGLDPEEVPRVFSRYAMHKSYNEKMGAEVLPLANWYKWYRIEKLSEGHAMTQAPAEGCSVSEAAPGQIPTGPLATERQFLDLLELYDSAGN